MNKDELLKTELSTLLEEYRQLKAEIVSNLEAGRQVANLTLTAAGVLIATISTPRPPTWPELGLILIDILGLIYSAFWGMQAERRR